MRALSAEAQLALEQRAVKIRDFIWFTVRDRETLEPVQAGFWSDAQSIDAQVINPLTGGIETRTFDGAGALIEIAPIPLVSNLTVQTVDVTLSQLSNANDLIRAYDAKQARVNIWRGLFALGSLQQLSPAFPRFSGFVDEPDILTPAENEPGSITLTCVSNTQELTRSNPATRSDAYQRQRDEGDSFRQHAAVVGTWKINWGRKA